MGARQKLNAAYFNGAVLLAIVAGVATGSPLVGIATLAAGVACSLVSHDIRLQSRKRP